MWFVTCEVGLVVQLQQNKLRSNRETVFCTRQNKTVELGSHRADRFVQAQCTEEASGGSASAQVLCTRLWLSDELL